MAHDAPSSRAVIHRGAIIGHVWPDEYGEYDERLPWTACLPAGVQRRFPSEDLAIVWLVEIAERAEGG